MTSPASSNSGNARKPLRIWFDGCFDLMHFGHANALRQAKAMGDILVVGVHSDEEVERHKGMPVMRYEERLKAVQACKWVDEVVPDVPYVTSLEIMDQHGCDICVHGDDLTTAADGSDSYAAVKAAGRFKECKRTEGVSTTELVGRMLLMARTQHPSQEKSLEDLKSVQSFSSDKKVSAMLPSTKRITQFASLREACPGDRIIYVDGGFDLFHIGHIELLKRARELGDYLIVGVHDDATINRIRGHNYPVMNLHERVLGVLSCRYVDEVIIGAPYSVSADLLKSARVHRVVHGATSYPPDVDGQDPYATPKALGIYAEVRTDYSGMTAESIIERIIAQRHVYEERNRKKLAKDAAAEQRKASSLLSNGSAQPS